MPRITSLQVQKNDPERVNVYLDDEFAFGLSAMLVLARNLSPGQELSQHDIENLQGDESVERSYGAALNFLSYRPRSRREIADYFRRKKIDLDVVEAVVARLERAGLLDDQEFARFWVDNRQSFRPRGTRALRMELRQKGLESGVIDEALAQVGDEEDTAYATGLTRVRTYGAFDEREFSRKMIGFLQRRGFPYAAASAAAKRLWDEQD